ncbi:MAG: hypothetical protein ACJAXX_001972, partial [Roseivirga sp.]
SASCSSAESFLLLDFECQNNEHHNYSSPTIFGYIS